jgi:hypothetical protein
MIRLVSSAFVKDFKTEGLSFWSGDDVESKLYRSDYGLNVLRVDALRGSICVAPGRRPMRDSTLWRW